MTPLELLGVAGLGLGAGVIGGLSGMGGSLIMLPGLHLLHPGATAEDHHLFAAAAMSVNVAVAIPAAHRHRASGAVRIDVLRTVLPAALCFIVAGVLVSNRINGDRLKLALAVFIFAYCGFNLWRLLRGSGADPEAPERASTPLLATCGAATGSTAGLLGLGGGVVLVPMLQLVCRVPLRQSIATSSAVICVTAIFGAGLKLATLGSHDRSMTDALVLAALMAPTAIVGARLGAMLTHSLPLTGVRLAVTVLLALAAGNLIRSSL